MTAYPRHAASSLAEALEDSPVVLIQGPRQCGKTTFARDQCEPLGYAYLDFDNPVQRAAAREDPLGFVAGLPDRVVLDEAQKAPELFDALKIAVDRDDRNGRFVITGSSNLALVRAIHESLAGRMRTIRLHPLSQVELARHAKGSFLQSLFQGSFPTRTADRLSDDLASIVASGGYPRALALPTARRRSAWHRDYVAQVTQTDVRDIARPRSMDLIPRLLAAAASQTARLYNLAKLASAFSVHRNTVAYYVSVLEHVFLLEHLPAWRANRLKRLVKAPKLHMSDSGLACSLTRIQPKGLLVDRELFGQALETFVYQELRRQAVAEEEHYSFFHYRDRDAYEVDIVIEQDSLAVAGVDVKASATAKPSHFRGLRKLRSACGKRFAAGVVLYDGEACASFGRSLFAVPMRRLWEARS